MNNHSNVPIVDVKEVEKVGLESYVKRKKDLDDKAKLKIIKEEIKRYQLIT